ncbi:MAG: riboflavin synthase [Planctomycetota bacterium]|nr:riboflavin synthase [Planctomycetota bacterium]
MFTGLVKAIGVLRAIAPRGHSRRLTVDVSGLPQQPAIGESVAISGVCLTAIASQGGEAVFDAVEETVARTTLANLQPSARVNLEPALRLGDPLDGHIVLGHVDAVARVLAVRQLPGSWEFRFSLPTAIAPLVAAKGSIAVDGVSLTVVEAGSDYFTVAVIPHTFQVTTLGERRPGDLVNLEADVLARYAARWQEMRGAAGLSAERLRASGF